MSPAEDVLFRLEPLGKHHDRADFSCGVDGLDRYLKTQATQDMRRKANAVFVLIPRDTPAKITGYFTLCAYGLAPGVIPESAQKHLPRYPVVSATLIGRLAVRLDAQGMGIGSLLLAKALQKAYENSSVVGSSMVVVDALDDRAVSFYQAHGFIRLPESMRLLLPMHIVENLLSR
jgi:GNAT superfamily N-acetyltransferase